MKSLRFPFMLLGASIFAFFCVFATAEAQDPGRYVISAKAGGINLSSGGVTVRQRGKTAWQPIAAKDRLNSGDIVRTDADGRVEILLNPGSYLRVGADSELELTDPSLDSLRIKMLKGSSILEVAGFGGAKVLTEIETPQTRIAIVQNGLYRIDVQPNATDLLVRKGRALVGGDAHLKVKRGKKVEVTSPEKIEVASFDKKRQDPLDVWSLRRAETLVAANRKISNPNLAYSIALAMNRGWGYYPWSYGRLGVWIYDPFIACSIFYPFYSGIYSPYGYGYSGNFGIPAGYYTPPTPASSETPPSASSPQPEPPNSGRRRGPNGPDGDLPVRVVAPDRHEVQALRQLEARDFYQTRASETFDRGDSQPSQSRHSEAGLSGAPVYSSAPSVGRSSGSGEGGGGRAESRTPR